MRFASLAQPERRSERFSAFEIMMRESPSVQYVGAEPWKATPRPSSSEGRLLSDARSLYELHTARIWRERMHALVQPVVQTGEFAGLLRGYQVDALHAGGQMFRVAQIPSQTQEVAGKPQNEGQFFLAGIAAYFPGQFLDGLER